MSDNRNPEGAVEGSRLRAKGTFVRAPHARYLTEVRENLRRLEWLANRAREATAAVTRAGGWWLISFFIFVLAPSFMFLLYLAAWQSNGYEAEAKITVRGAQEFKGSTSDMSGIISRMTSGGFSSKATIQDSYIVLNYINSSALVNDLGGKLLLEKYFSKSSIDYFSRMPKSATIEAVTKYWTSHVHASVDTVSGILTIRVVAYSAADAHALAKAIIDLGERLINEISERSRKDAVDRAEREVALAADRLAATRDKLTLFRDQNALIDPGTRAKNIGELIAKLTLDKLTIQSTLDTLSGSLGSDSPTQRIQRDRLAAIDRQISDLNAALTSSNSDGAVSAQIAGYERLKLDEQFDELMYKVAMDSYERARQERERQQLYLAIVTSPTEPQEPTYPRIVANASLLFLALVVFWSIGALIGASIQDQLM